MTDEQLQKAIDAARAFMNLEAMHGGLLYKAKEKTSISLNELERIQVVRAGSPSLVTTEEVSKYDK